jgi:hypothetical protein
MEKTEVTNKPKETEPTIVFEVTREDEPKKIKAEISIEIIGEDEPTKYDKRRKRWAAVTRFSLWVFVVSLIVSMFLPLNIVSLIIIPLSFTVFMYAMDEANSLHPDEPGYYDNPLSGLM